MKFQEISFSLVSFAAVFLVTQVLRDIQKTAGKETILVPVLLILTITHLSAVLLNIVLSASFFETQTGILQSVSAN